MIKFWNASLQYQNDKVEIDAAIQDVLNSGNLVLGAGEYVPKFEKEFADFIGAKHAIMVGAGTQALYLAYRVLGIGQGDEVITTSHTFIATIDQIIALGAKPVLVDIGEDGLIDPVEIEKAITPLTRAIVPVHLEGKVCDMERIHELAKKHNLLVIEDAAQAIGAKGVGTAHASCYSMFPAKVLGSLGNAGCITTDDDTLAKRLRMMRCNWNIGKNPDLDVEFGTNMEPDNIHAAVLSVRLAKLPARLARRWEVAKRYYFGLKDTPLLFPDQQNGRIYQDFVIRVQEGRGLLVKHLQENGVGIIGHNLQPNHRYQALGLDFDLPRTDEYIWSQIRIPCNPEITDEEVQYVIDTIKKFYHV